VLTLLLFAGCGSVTQGLEADLGRRLSATRDSFDTLAGLNRFPDAPQIRSAVDDEFRRLGDVDTRLLSDEPKRLGDLEPGRLLRFGELENLPPTFSRLFGEGDRLEQAWNQTLELWVQQQRFGN